MQNFECKRVRNGALSGDYAYEVKQGDKTYTVRRVHHPEGKLFIEVEAKDFCYMAVLPSHTGEPTFEDYKDTLNNIEWHKDGQRWFGSVHGDGKNKPSFVLFSVCDGKLVRYQDALGKSMGEDMIFDSATGHYEHYDKASKEAKQQNSNSYPPFEPDNITPKQAEEEFQKNVGESVAHRDNLLSICHAIPLERPFFQRVSESIQNGVQAAKSWVSKGRE